MANFLDTDYAWAAGIIDGEGWIGFQGRRKSERKARQIRVAVANTDSGMLEKLKSMFQGSLRPMHVTGNRKPISAWLVASRQAESCLRQILPYLLTKRRQAQFALEARTYLGKPGRWSQQKPNWIALERLDRELHDLNKRGIT